MKISKYELKKAEPRVADPPVDGSESAKNVPTKTQWLSVISIFVSLAGIYYKREEIKSFLDQKPYQNVDAMPKAPPPSLVDTATESKIPLPVNSASKRKPGISLMD